MMHMLNFGVMINKLNADIVQSLFSLLDKATHNKADTYRAEFL
jgi:hypothetical protein